MEFKIGMIASAGTVQLLRYLERKDTFHRALLLLCHAYDIPVGYFPVSTLTVDGDALSGEAIYWDGTAFSSTHARLPAIVDNGSPLRGSAMHQIPDAVMERLVRGGVLSNGAVGKAGLSELLMMSGLAAYAIPTREVKSYEQMLSVLALWGHCIYKPKGGRKGRGVLELQQTESGELLFSSATDSGILTPAQYTALRERFPEYQTYLMQPRLDFHTAEGHALDFRLLVSRGAGGDWETVAIYPRIGASGVVSNVSRGGYIGDAEEVLQVEFPDAAERLHEELISLAEQIPRLIQSILSAPVCCLGIDVGIDRASLQAYVIEANTFPGTKYHAYPLAQARLRYYRHLLDRHLTALPPQG